MMSSIYKFEITDSCTTVEQVEQCLSHGTQTVFLMGKEEKEM